MGENSRNKEHELADVVSNPAWVHVVTVLIGLFFAVVIGGVFHLDGMFNHEVLIKADVGLNRWFMIGLIVALCVAALVAMVSFEKQYSLRRSAKTRNKSEF